MYSFSFLFWTLSNAYFQSPLLTYFNKSVAIFMAILANTACGFGILFAFHLSYVFLSRSKKRTIKRVMEDYIVSVLISLALILNLIPNLIIAGIEINGPMKFRLIQGPLTPFFFGSGVVFIIWTLTNFIKSYRTSVRVQQEKARYMILGISFTLISVLIFDIVIPSYNENYDLVWLPPVISLFEMILFGYALLSIRFYSIRLSFYKILTYSFTLATYAFLLFCVQKSFYMQDVKALLATIVLLVLCVILSANHVMRFWSYLLSKAFYHDMQNPVEEIRIAVNSFEEGLQRGLQKLSEVFNVSNVKISLSGTSEYNYFVPHLDKAGYSELVRNEIDYKVHHMPQGQQEEKALVSIKSKMEETGVSLLIPIIHNHEHIGVLLFEDKRENLFFYKEHLMALFGLSVSIGAYIKLYQEKTSMEEKIKSYKDKFVALSGSLAHEVRNSLNVIAAVNQKSKDDIGKYPHQMTHLQQSLLDNSQKIDRVIESCSSITKLLLQNLKNEKIDASNFELLSMGSEIKDALAEYPFQGRQQEKVSLSLINDFYFLGSKPLFRNVLYNLLNNAIYYFKEKPTATITITVDSTQEGNVLYVKDTGVGIPADKVPLLFHDFMTSNKKGGTGLGLSFCARVVESFHATISCQSVVGEYTEFQLHFPLIEKKPSPPKENLIQHLNNQTVFILDDDEIQIQTLEIFLGDTELDIHYFTDARSLLAKAKEVVPALIFTDLNIWEFEPQELVDKLISLVPKPIVVSISGEEPTKDMKDSLDDYLVKPVNKKVMMAMVNKALRL